MQRLYVYLYLMYLALKFCTEMTSKMEAGNFSFFVIKLEKTTLAWVHMRPMCPRYCIRHRTAGIKIFLVSKDFLVFLNFQPNPEPHYAIRAGNSRQLVTHLS